ncbi:hypothetical protein LCGC14_1005590 [marine sediment metagenome]|uniref:Uncharacterized protein n=1 Tax=marine sediment metagenome TaxID=412755 RepID=A0A0F9R7U4_9ZZZZ
MIRKPLKQNKKPKKKMTKNEDGSQALKTLWKERRAKQLVKLLFGYDLTPTQVEIVRTIGWSEKKRLSICAMTRYGKSLSIVLGIGLYLIRNKNKRIAFIAPQKEQAEILMNYMTDLILNSSVLLSIVDIDLKGPERMRKEVSKRRMTFKTGCEYRIFSAHGEASRLMGFGADVVIKDEACLIKGEGVNARIMRMLGDNPEESILIESFNPWDRDNKAFEHLDDPAFHKIHVPWQTALEEGRTTQAFIDEQRKELLPLEFTVLYDSEFPAESEDSIFNLVKINRAEEQKRDLIEETKEIIEQMKRPQDRTEAEFKKVKEKFNEVTRIISCDVADKGLDETVIFWGIKKVGFYQVTGAYSEPKSESTDVAGRINEKIKEFIGHEIKGEVYIDSIGLGTGVVSMVKEYIRDNMYKNVRVIGCNFGAAPINKDRFRNKKAENNFRLKDIFDEDSIKLIKVKNLKNQLLNMKWKRSSTEKIVIEDPEKSPDWADALVYFIWKDTDALIYAFLK